VSDNRTAWWLVALLTSIMLTGLAVGVPLGIAVLRHPSRDQVERIEERQQTVLQTLPVIQQRVASLEVEVQMLNDLLREHDSR
jgi:ABC-type proline/glycine betaine transport system permease subunit